MDDLISRQAAIDAPEEFIKDCNPDHFIGNQKFIEFMDNAEIGSFGNWQFANGFNMGLTAAEVAIKKLPSAQPEITLESAIDYLHSIGWMQEHDRIMVESAQPERKKGEWIIHNVSSRNCHPTNRHFAECSECGTLTREWRGNLFPPRLRFCTNCGADMRGEQDERSD